MDIFANQMVWVDSCRFISRNKRHTNGCFPTIICNLQAKNNTKLTRVQREVHKVANMDGSKLSK